MSEKFIPEGEGGINEERGDGEEYIGDCGDDGVDIGLGAYIF